jgi:hypothetical protein
MQETVTKDELRRMRVRQTRIFTLADIKKVKSIKVQANDLKNEEGKVYEIHPDLGSSAVCIIRKK